MIIKSNDSKYAISTAALVLTASVFSVSPFSTAFAQEQACTVTTAAGTSLSFARQEFSQSCPDRVRRDCDPFQGGWQCSTENLPLIETTNTPTPPPPTAPTPPEGDAVLSLQAEDAAETTGSGWVIEQSLSGFEGSGYIVWRGSNDFRATDSAPPAGIKHYDFTITQAGTYEFTARAQARVGNGSAPNDQDNDGWVKFISGSATAGIQGDSAKWTKFFVSGSDESWKNYRRGQQYDPDLFTEIQRDLSVGTHRVLIGGRSTRFAIDSIGLELISAGTPQEPTPTPEEPAPAPTPEEPAPAPIPEEPTPAPEEPISPPEIPTSACTVQGSSLSIARSNYAQSCPNIPRVDCDQIAGGDWLCSSERNPTAPTVEPPVAPPEVPPVAPPVAPPAAPPENTPTQPTIGRLSQGDLLALHYDNCPDRDDGHAVVAGRAVIDTVNISRFLIVNGTCGYDIFDEYQPSSEAVLNATYGNNNWLDWIVDDTNAVNTSADQWAAILANGDEVWVAEGGPSDFTAEVLRRLQRVYPSVDLGRVNVVQHSGGFNQIYTSDDALDLVRDETNYILINDGNRGGNGTADLNQRSNDFVDAALQSSLASAWEAAFDYLSPNRKLDFSDTVELLYIIDDTSTDNPDDFADRYVR